MGPALRSFFDQSETPAAICNNNFDIVAVNRAFCECLDVADAAVLKNRALASLFPKAPFLEPGSEDDFVTMELPGGEPAIVNMSPSGEHLLVTIHARSDYFVSKVKSGEIEKHYRVLETGHLLSIVMTEEDLVGVTARCLRELFPGRCFAIRVIDPGTKDLVSFYSDGPLIPGEHGLLVIDESVISEHHLPDDALGDDKVVITDSYHRIFEGTEFGIGVPLVSGGRLLGLINIEDSAGQLQEADFDKRLLNSLADQLSTALANARLLRESRYLKNYLEKVIDNANALILVIDRQERLSMFNKAFQELTGLARDAAIGSKVQDVFVPEDRAEISRVVEKASKGVSTSNIEASVIRQDGRHVRVAFNTATVFNSDGRIESVIAIGNDLTRLWDLERRVIQAEKLASVGQLSAAVIHELNNPLTSIAVYAEYIRERLSQVGTDRDVDRATRILESTDRIMKFTKNLIAYARPSDDRMARLDLRQVIEQSCRLCEHVMKDSNAAFNLEWNDEIPRVMGNLGKLQQVFINLLTNACHAVDKGGSITVNGISVDDKVEVRVKDDGQGMTPDVSKRIFEPFFSTKPAGRGTGLGLPIVQEIIRRHGGTIGVSSKPGEGTEFLIRLSKSPEDD